MIYREATFSDTEKIALLHAQSWQRNYRGILLDDYLDNTVYNDRLATWKGRLQAPAENQYILLAEEDNILCGLACVFANHDPVWGALLDNLHVTADKKGKGIGTQLLVSAAKWAYTQNPGNNFYLWVYEKNTAARKFYEGLGGINQEVTITDNPGGGSASICRYVWTDVQKLIDQYL